MATSRAPKMTLQTLKVLHLLASEPDEPHYGLEISRAIGLASGTLYPILIRLEGAGWVESEWEDIDPHAEGRRPRRYYRITGEGQAEAREALRPLLETPAPRPSGLGSRAPRPGLAGA